MSDARLFLALSVIVWTTGLVSDQPSVPFGNDGPLSGCTIAAGVEPQLDGTPECRDIRMALGAVLGMS